MFSETNALKPSTAIVVDAQENHEDSLMKRIGMDIKWLIEGRIISIRATGALSLEVLQDAGKTLGQMITQQQQPVHLLFDFTHSRGLPLNLKAVSNAVRPFMSHPNVGWVIVYGTDDLIMRMFSAIISQTFMTQFRMLRTRDEALHFLQEHDKALPPLDDAYPRANLA